MECHSQVYYIVKRIDPAVGPYGLYLNLIRDSTWHERFEFTSSHKNASYLDEHTAYEKLHSCQLHFDGTYAVKKLQVDYTISDP